MALAGEGAILIWNDVTPEGRDDFYAWHLAEHMPERVGIPGFTRGRRYIAEGSGTAPEFFTLYETVSPEVQLGQDYLARLNAPTPWTRRATQGFRNTARALTRVRFSAGPGAGGALATLRLGLEAGAAEALVTALAAGPLPRLALRPRLTGVHLCLTNQGASAERTAESRERTDIQAAPDGAVLVEGCDPAAVAAAVAELAAEPALAGLVLATGFYRLEHERLKTAHAPAP
ncbi:MAG: hypothetical protein OHK0024_01500 [Thalassobaculales bacterium]